MLIVDPIFDVGRNGWAWHDVDNVVVRVAAANNRRLWRIILILISSARRC